jgi:hypothetical protein
MKFIFRTAAQIVIAPGIRMPLSTKQVWVRGLKIQTPTTNDGVIYIGDITVTAANGLLILEDSAISFDDLFPDQEDLTLNLGDIYIDSETAGNKITFMYLEEAKK